MKKLDVAIPVTVCPRTFINPGGGPAKMVALAQVVGIPLSANPVGRDSLPIGGPCVRPVGIGCWHRLSAYPWSDLVGIV